MAAETEFHLQPDAIGAPLNQVLRPIAVVLQPQLAVFGRIPGQVARKAFAGVAHRIGGGIAISRSIFPAQPGYPSGPEAPQGLREQPPVFQRFLTWHPCIASLITSPQYFRMPGNKWKSSLRTGGLPFQVPVCAEYIGVGVIAAGIRSPQSGNTEVHAERVRQVEAVKPACRIEQVAKIARVSVKQLMSGNVLARSIEETGDSLPLRILHAHD